MFEIKCKECNGSGLVQVGDSEHVNSCKVCDGLGYTDLTLDEIYDLLPMTERTLRKRYKSYPFKIANDRGESCSWYIYEDNQPVAVVTYYKGRKLVMHTVKQQPTQQELEQLEIKHHHNAIGCRNGRVEN